MPLLCCAGKSKVGEVAGAGEEQPCLEVLLGLPSRPVCRRSDQHMLQCLEVRVVVVGWGLF